MQVMKISDAIANFNNLNYTPFTVSYFTIKSTLSESQSGKLERSDVWTAKTMTFYPAAIMKQYMAEFYDWRFIWYDDTVTDAYEGFFVLFTKFFATRIEMLAKAMTAIMSDYNPLENYDRYDLTKYRSTLNHDNTKDGERQLTKTFEGTVRTRTIGQASSVEDSQSGQKKSTSPVASFQNDSISVSDGTVTAGTTPKQTNYVNSYEDDTSAVPAKMTESNQTEGTTSSISSSASGTVSEVSYGTGDNAHIVTDTETFTEYTDNTTEPHTGEDGLISWGNIGVTSSTQLSEEEYAYRMSIDIQRDLFRTFIKEKCFL